MNDLTPNIPEVVAEVRELFERYEQALIDKDVEVLDATFWNSPHTIRYALNENGYGFGGSTRTGWRGRPGPASRKAHPPRDPDARARSRHREPRVQGARPRAHRPPEPDVGAVPRRGLEGRRRPRLHHERRAARGERDPRSTASSRAARVTLELLIGPDDGGAE